MRVEVQTSIHVEIARRELPKARMKVMRLNLDKSQE